MKFKINIDWKPKKTSVKLDATFWIAVIMSGFLGIGLSGTLFSLFNAPISWLIQLFGLIYGFL